MSFASQIRFTARRDLDRQLKQLSLVDAQARPQRGWLRAIRDALGMTAAQLGARLGITPTSVFEMERREADGSITLKTLEKAAEALNCSLVYALIPNESLDAIVHKQARKVAAKHLERVANSMRLENQGVSSEDSRAQLENLIVEIIRTRPRSIWADT